MMRTAGFHQSLSLINTKFLPFQLILNFFCIPTTMALKRSHFSSVLLFLISVITVTTSQFTPSKKLTDLFPHLSFKDATSVTFGAQNIKYLDTNGTFASISLDKSSGSGLESNDRYSYGFFSAALKLPPGYTSGVVVTFYLSNSCKFPHNHDEVDFELLGHETRKEWVLQTNIYGNGSVSTGREEKFRLWFDPTAQFHDYSILWNNHHTLFLVDNIPIRQVVNTEAMAPAYPSKPMSLQATIWDASDWATSGGKYPVDYNYAPFIAGLGKLEMSGCVVPSDQTACPDTSSSSTLDGQTFAKLSDDQLKGLEWARNKYMIYSYCKDTKRYKIMPPECKTH